MDPAQSSEVSGHLRQHIGASGSAATPQDQALGVAVLGRDGLGLAEQDDLMSRVADGGGVDITGLSQEDLHGASLPRRRASAQPGGVPTRPRSLAARPGGVGRPVPHAEPAPYRQGEAR